MSYVPPRGPCSQRLNLMTSCACHRFMVHPLKAATSYDCDGCGHHASFHRMESKDDEEALKRWRAKEEEDAYSRAVNPSKETALGQKLITNGEACNDSRHGCADDCVIVQHKRYRTDDNTETCLDRDIQGNREIKGLAGRKRKARADALS